MNEDKIRRELDSCLLSDEELEEYTALKESIDGELELLLELDEPRFTVGHQVEALTAAGWVKGIVVALNYREADWERNRVAPYQVLSCLLQE